jgi:hypothetical protein
MTISRNLSILAEGVSSSGVLAVTNGGTGVTTSTGSGSSVLSASPTLTGTLTVPTVTSPAATALTVQSAGTTAMTIDTSQNVGIGVTSPGAKLDVAGSIWSRPGNATGAIAILSADATSGANGASLSASFATGGYGPLKFLTTNTEAMRIDSSGNVGIGTSSPGQKLDVVNTANSAVAVRLNSTNSGSSTSGAFILGNDADSSVFYIQQNSSGNTTLGGANSVNLFSKAGAMTFSTASTEAMRVDSSGNLLVGTTSQIRSSKLSIVGGDLYAPGFRVGGTTSNLYIYEGATNILNFQVGNTGSFRYFSFDTSGNGNALNGSWVNGSDARLKENVKTLDKGLLEVLSLHPVSYNRIGAEQTEIGFIAQEMRSILPEVVHDTGEYLGISYGNITAVLVKAIQELSAKNDALETRLTALEAKQ